jgi:hypothetical protein
LKPQCSARIETNQNDALNIFQRISAHFLCFVRFLGRDQKTSWSLVSAEVINLAAELFAPLIFLGFLDDQLLLNGSESSRLELGPHFQV